MRIHFNNELGLYFVFGTYGTVRVRKTPESTTVLLSRISRVKSVT